MLSVNKNQILLLLCMLIAVMLCVSHIFAITEVLVFSMALYLGVIIWTSLKGQAQYMLCFFLPWAPLIKFEPGTVSIYTVGLIGACIISWVRYRFTVKRYVLPAAALIVLTFVVKLFCGYGIDNNFLMFCLMLLFFPILLLDLQKKYDFYHLNLFLTIGIIGASLSAYYLVRYSNIAKFIDVYTLQNLTRYSGYYGDANYYSAHITAALAGYLLLFLRSPKKIWESVIMSVILLYCGLLSGSKSFIITVALLLVLWVLLFFRIKRNLSYKLITVIVVLASGLLIIQSDEFMNLFNIIMIRFGKVIDISYITTGRSDIWMNYLRYLAENPVTMFFGKGYTNILADEHSTHNTVLQCIYQFGIIGSAALAFWMKNTFGLALQHLNMKRGQILSYLILAVGIFMPWMGIDLLFFDEFFIMLFYVCLGIMWIHDEPLMIQPDAEE